MAVDTTRMNQYSFPGMSPSYAATNNYQMQSDGTITAINNNGQAVNIFLAPEFGNYGAGYENAAGNLIDHYRKQGRLKELKQKVAKVYNYAGFANDVAFVQSLTSLLTQVSANNYFAAQNAPKGKTGKWLSVMEYLDGVLATTSAAGGGGSSSPDGTTTSIDITGRQEAWRYFKEASQQLSGITPTKQDFEAYYKKLVQNQKNFKNTVKISGNGTKRTTTSNNFDIQGFTVDFIVSSIDLSNPNLKNAARSQMQKVNQLVNDNGVAAFMTQKAKNKLIKGLLNGDLNEESVNDAIRKHAILAYPQWADEMKNNPEMSFADIIAPYSQQYANTLEISGDVDVTDVARLATVNGQKLSLFDFQKSLRNDSRWSKTKQASDEAYNLAKSIAKSFGVK